MNRVIGNKGGITPMWKRKETPPVNPAVIPVMDITALRNAIKEGVGGPSMCMLHYAHDTFEIVSGQWNVLVEEQGSISYWVGDRLVGVMGSSGEPEPMPSLRSLRVNYSYPLDTLTTEVLPESRAA